MTKSINKNEITFKSFFEGDADFQQYGPNALGVFALSLYLRLEDLIEFATNSITDGFNDKKLDICYLNEEEGFLLLAQCYLSPNWKRKSALENKASDLSSAVAWLLSSSEDDIPPGLKTKAFEARRALREGRLRKIEILYIHNCQESKNVEGQLKTVANAAKDIASSFLGDENTTLSVSHREMGINVIEELFITRDSEILIEDWIEVPFQKFVEETGAEWKAVVASIPLSWVRRLYKLHGDRLFSANYRDYLGYVKREENINYQIVTTAESEPQNFWVYNNGITALTYELKLGRKRKIRGISIINGAQTTGALEATKEQAAAKGKVLIRLVECDSKDVVDRIIRYNNTQNEIKPADIRSNDSTQRHLKTEFEKFGIEYIHRRSSSRASRNSISAAAVGPALCAFHGDPQTAYRNSSSIFTEDKKYHEVFPETTKAQHIFLIRMLSMAIDRIKAELKVKVSEKTATNLETNEYEVLKYSASKHFIFYIIGQLAEEILEKKVANLHNWICIDGVVSQQNNSLLQAWEVTLRALMPQITTAIQKRGEGAFYEVPRSIIMSREVANELKGVIASLEPQLGPLFTDLRDRTRS